jgi:hypothetical protein
MRYVEFRDRVVEELRRHPSGHTWAVLRDRLDLPYDRPCPTWIRRMETESGLVREKGAGRAYVWTVRR